MDKNDNKRPKATKNYRKKKDTREDGQPNDNFYHADKLIRLNNWYKGYGTGKQLQWLCVFARVFVHL